ncbi:MAG: response regulator transcription factor, partial [Gammaproteobacteria bacterium]|nr:response regulator transcription factor [Gammaproteobacteria bacterium]
QQGARGYIPKSSPTKIILNALQLVIAGGTYVPAQILQNKTFETNNQPIQNTANNHNLTPRQMEVLHELVKGKSNKDIGKALDLTESTIRAHVAAILKSFIVSNRTQAVQHATQNGYV